MTTADLAVQRTLEDLIDQLINLGHKNPHDFPQLLERTYGDQLDTIVKPYLSDFIAEMGRQRINNRRRAQVAKITNETLERADVMLLSLWVPATNEGTGILYKALGDMTADDFEARATYLERLAYGIHRHAHWCRTVADNIRTAGVPTASGLDKLPPLPDPLELEA